MATPVRPLLACPVLVRLTALLLMCALTACAGISEFESCMQQAADEGRGRQVAEQACRDAGLDD